MRPLLWLSYAAKNLRSGLKGFYILLACLALGVAAMATIGSLTAAVQQGLAEQGQPLLGGDIEFALNQRQATSTELTFMHEKGQLSMVATLRGMASAKGQATLVEVKAVDAAYPLYGRLQLDGSTQNPDIFALHAGNHGIAVDPLLLGRLHLALGDTLKIGSEEFRVAATIVNEPDRLSDGITLGPRVLMSHEALQKTALLQPGSLITWRYRLKLPSPQSVEAAKQVARQADAQFPQAGWRMRETDKAAGGAERFVERLGYFMTLVSLAALVVGGTGMANAITAFVHRRTSVIAMLKCLGLPVVDVVGLYLTEILLVGFIGIAVALLVGAAAPVTLSAVAGSWLPLPLSKVVQWKPLLSAALMGFLVLMAFSALPLSAIVNIRGSQLFRGSIGLAGTGRAWKWLLLSAGLLLTAAALQVLWAENPRITLLYLAGLGASFVVLGLSAFALLRLLGRIPKPGNVLLRHALAAIQRPSASSFSIILALGLGLSLFVTLALTDRTLSHELRSSIPEKAPAFFFLDVQNDVLPNFKQALLKHAGVTQVENAPMLRGRITEIKGVPAEKIVAKPEAAWALQGDRGLTFADAVPEGSELVAGKWWPQNYEGPPLVSLVDEIADGLNIKLGDSLKVNVLGRELTVEVASFRRVNWRSMGINFVMVFSPNSLRAAPHAHIVTVEMQGGDEATLLNDMASEFPSVTAVRVKDALATVSSLLAQMLAAVRGANGLTLLTGVFVLAGALASGLSTRSYESVVLKTHGATRNQLLAAFMIEYGLLGLVAAAFGILTGSLGAWYLARVILEMPWQFSAVTAAMTAGLAMLLSISAGLIVTLRALSAKPSTYLRNE